MGTWLHGLVSIVNAIALALVGVFIVGSFVLSRMDRAENSQREVSAAASSLDVKRVAPQEDRATPPPWSSVRPVHDSDLPRCMWQK